MERAYHRWYSPNVQRDMELLVFGHTGQRVLVFPTRQGRFYDYENWGLADAVRGRIEHGELQLFCVDSFDSHSLYDWNITPRERVEHLRWFERYVLEEVLPLTRTLNPTGPLVAHGCSIGAYHAVNIAFRNPALFRRVVALSGRFDLTHAYAWYPDLFSGYYDNDVYLNTPNHFVPNIGDRALLEHFRALDIRLVIGEFDYFYGSNKQLSNALWNKGIWHAFHMWEGRAAHSAQYWREMIALYLI